MKVFSKHSPANLIISALYNECKNRSLSAYWYGSLGEINLPDAFEDPSDVDASEAYVAKVYEQKPESRFVKRHAADVRKRAVDWRAIRALCMQYPTEVNEFFKQLADKAAKESE